MTGAYREYFTSPSGLTTHCFAMADKTTRGPLRWVRGDMHNHCEDHALVAEHLEGASNALDFIALTNHAQKPVFFEQHRMIEQARCILPGVPIFFGLDSG